MYANFVRALRLIIIPLLRHTPNMRTSSIRCAGLGEYCSVVSRFQISD